MTEKARGLVLFIIFMATTLSQTWSAESNLGTTSETVAPADNQDSSQHDLDKRATYLLQEDKRTQLGFHGMRGKKDSEQVDFYPVPLPPLREWEKRASLGFHGMRGKKWEDDQDLMKRAAMGFQGMRGKKWDYYDSLKRASMGFQGMRGKKDEADKRASMGFQGMRGKKLYEDDSYEPQDNAAFYNDEKRAMAGFQGMRGKKYDESSDELDLVKRAAMGFQGMRGKKDDSYDDLEKRAMGFQGMRGKKDYADQFLDSELDKRAMGFHGMRGKKLTDYSFKRAMGFLGMRGKKANEDWTQVERRAPHNTGFVGMRGKKDSEDGDEIDGLLTYLRGTSPTLDRSRRSTPTTMAAIFGKHGQSSNKSQSGADPAE